MSASDFVTGYAGQAGIKTKEILTKARGKVLFIDEAYQLNPRHGGGSGSANYMTEVVDEIVKGLTSKELKGKMVVILAGYERDIDGMIKSNPGLRTRFPEKWPFPDMTAEHAATMLEAKLKTIHDLKLALSEASILLDLSTRLKSSPNFGNGRDVENWAKRISKEVANRVSVERLGTEDEPAAQDQDLQKALDSLLESKKETPGDDGDAEWVPTACVALPQTMSSAAPPSLPSMSASTAYAEPVRCAASAPSEPDNEELDFEDEDRDAGETDVHRRGRGARGW